MSQHWPNSRSEAGLGQSYYGADQGSYRQYESHNSNSDPHHQTRLASLDFGTTWSLPGLGPGEARDRSSNAVDGIFDLYAATPSNPQTQQQQSAPIAQPQYEPNQTPNHIPPRQPVRPPLHISGSSNSCSSTSLGLGMNGLPRRSPSGPRPLPLKSSSSSSAPSMSSPRSPRISESSVPEEQQPPSTPHSWTHRPRSAFPPAVRPPLSHAYESTSSASSSYTSKPSFDSATSSLDLPSSSDSGAHELARVKSTRRGMEASALPLDQLSALQELDTATPNTPSIVETPVVPPKDGPASPWGSGAAEDSLHRGNLFSPSASGHLSPNNSLTASGYLQRNMSTGTTNSFASSENDSQQPHINQALLSHMAIFLKDRVPRAEHVRGAIPYPMAFTGRDIVSTLERALSDEHKSRVMALQIAKSLHSQLLFFEVRDNDRPVQDGLDQVFVFPEDDGGGATWDELPSGVFVDVTGCYSPLCTILTARGVYVGSCMSPSCPNNITARKAAAQRVAAQSEGEAAAAKTPQEESAWAETVEPELLQLLGKKEVERQNQIHELIVGEATYVRDIELLRTEFLEPLTEAEPPIIPTDTQSSFFADVLCNAFDIKQQAQAFSDALVQRQREQGPVIQNIGDVVINAAVDWGLAYVQYAKAYPFADARIKAEKARNAPFDQTLTAFTRRPATRKLAVHSYQTRITIRLQRYILLLKGILKSTPEDNEDRFALMQAIEIIDQQCKESDAAVATSEAILECRRYHRELLAQGPQVKWLTELDLLDEQRRLIKKSKMYRRSDNASLSDFSKLDLLLFDNYLVLTNHSEKANKPDKFERLYLLRKPIPLQLVTAEGFDDPPVPRSSRLGLRSLNADGNSAQTTRDNRMLYPIHFVLVGRGSGTMTLYVDSAQTRQEWREALFEATERRETVMAEKSVFRVDVASWGPFRPRQKAQAGNPGGPIGRPTCSAPWTTQEGHELLAVGHEEGLWIGLRHDPRSLRLVVHLKGITQCSILQDFGLVLVLAAKVLVAYPIETLVPSSSRSHPNHSSRERETKEPQRLSGSKDVLFFKVGRIGQRLLVIYVKKDGVTQTVFKALEPVPIAERSTKGFMRRKTEWFKEYKVPHASALLRLRIACMLTECLPQEFFVPSECFGLLFLRSQLSIVCAKGFELMAIDKEPLRSISFPDWSQLKSDGRAVELQKRCDSSRSVAMFRISESEFLFVFEDLAFYADKHGDPIPRRYEDVIEWLGRARSVAYIPPYVVAFDDHFIEIRYASTGQLVQLIKGRSISCTHDGQAMNIDSSSSSGPAGSSQNVQVTMRLADPQFPGFDAYVVGELVRI